MHKVAGLKCAFGTRLYPVNNQRINNLIESYITLQNTAEMKSRGNEHKGGDFQT